MGTSAENESQLAQTTKPSGAKGGLHIDRVPLADLHQDPANARAHPDRNLDAIGDSLRSFGQVEPLVVQRGTGRVIGGNGRLAVMRREGQTHADVVYLDIDDHAATRLGIALNRTAELAEWDKETLASLLDGMGEADLLTTGFDADSLKDLLADLTPPVVVEDEAPEPLPDPVSKPGDLWELGGHRLLCGDSTKGEDVGRVMGGESLDAMITDPPYGINVVAKNGKIGADGLAKTNVYPKIVGDDKPFDPSHLVASAPSVVLFGANHFASRLPTSPGWIVWDKRDGMDSNSFADVELAWTNQDRPARLFRHMWSGMIKKGESGKRCHPTQKPIALLGWVIGEFASDATIIGDWYAGSGTTIIAAEQLGRKCYAIEIEPRYVDVAVRRWEKLTGKQATLNGQTFAQVAAARGVALV